MSNRRRMNFESLERRCLLSSVGWDGLGLGSASLTYHIGSVPASLSESEFREAIESAFSAWTDVVDITIEETTFVRQQNSIDISFASIDGAGDTLAEAYFPDDVNRSRIAGDVIFDSDETWEFGNARGRAATDLRLVAVHEIGHALGLDHSDDRGSVMYASVSPNTSFTGLSQSDVEAIRELYAARQTVIQGDFNFDGSVTELDISIMFDEIASNDNDPLFDLNEDAVVDESDRDVLIFEILGTGYGDANLDGLFDSSDLVLVLQAGKYEDDSPNSATWMTGDWNGDGLFDSSDLVLSLQQGIYANDAPI